jgi:outer membrane protein
MMKLHLTKKYTALTVLLFLVFQGYAQTSSDSLTYTFIIDAVIKNNPLIKQSEEKVTSSHLKEQLVRSAYLPSIYAASTVARIYPIPTLDIKFPDPESGDMLSRHMQMYPDFSMDYGIKINQMIYDFGKTGNNQALQQTLTEISQISTGQLKQRLALAAAGFYFNLLFVQKAINLKKDEIQTLNKHLAIIEKKQQTGSATQYEILATRVRISNTETQLADLQTSREVLTSHLSSLMGNSFSVYAVKEEPLHEDNSLSAEGFFDYALSNRDEMLLAAKNESLAEWTFKIAGSRNNPILSFFGTTGYKNGYISEINTLKFNYNAGLSLNIPIFDGHRKYISKQIAGSGIIESKLETDNVKNKINDEVKENYASLQLMQKKIDQYTDQLEMAKEAYRHAEINYEAGSITNLDLLNAANILAESELLLLKARIDRNYSKIKMDAALGEDLY